MILCLDIGNSQIFGGIFSGNDLLLRFRHSTRQGVSSDQIGVFLRSVLRENNIESNQIKQIALCSVAPANDYSVIGACRKYFNIEPFILQAGTKTGLKIKYRNPIEVGADRIANAIAAAHHYPHQNIIVVDFGTATTFCTISADRDYLGGLILAGIGLSMDALQSNTAKLMPVKIIKPEVTIGRSTAESIQAGLYYGQLAMVHSLSQRITEEAFDSTPPVIIGTGGFAHLFEQEKLFTRVMPDLVLDGLRLALVMNQESCAQTVV